MRQLRVTHSRRRSLAGALVAFSMLGLAETSSAEPLARTSSGAHGQTGDIAGTASALQLGNAFAAVANAVRPAVVFMRTETVRRGFRVPRDAPSALHGAYIPGLFPRATMSSGTGFIILPNGYIVTNQHVIADARRVFVRLFDGREYAADIIGEDALSDIAVLKIDESDLPTAWLGDSDELRVGEWVLAIGNPLGSTLLFSVTAGSW